MKFSETEIDITIFFEGFKRFYDFIDKKCQDRIEGIILACAYLDSLSGYKYGDGSNAKRFINFVKTYSGFGDKYDLVSIPLLSYHLADLKSFDRNFVKIIKDEFEIYNYKFEYLGHSVDVNMIDLEKRLKGKISDKDIDYIKHHALRFEYAQILWQDYRCNLIHESRLRNPGAINLQQTSEPYYVVLTNLDKDMKVKDEFIVFAFPPTFIMKTLHNCIVNFENECRRDMIDPFKIKDDKKK